jgi:putative CocE/NonD family hydrolase
MTWVAERPAFRVEKDVPARMRDGAILRADVWRPDDDDAYPALLQRTPYQKEITGSDDWLRLELAVPEGYAVVVQDVRGRFSSDGVWHGLTADTWEQEARDTYDTVEWVAAQPWCDGRVAIYGGSYLGAIGFLGAQARPPHLRAIAPAVIGSQDRAHLETGGAFYLRLWIEYHLNMLVSQLPKLQEDGTVSAADAARIRALARDSNSVIEYLPLRECPYFDIPGIPFSLDELLSGDGIGLPPSFALDEIDVPVLLIGGWHDLYCARTIDNYQRLRASSTRSAAVRDADRLIMGPWTHSLPTRTQGDLDFGAESLARTSVHPAQLRFFDKHLRGKPDDLPPVRYFVMGANEWREADRWPPADTTAQTWYIHSDLLSREPSTMPQPPDTYVYDPANPVRTIGGRVGGIAGPRDQSRLASRADLLRYTSEALAEKLEIVGNVTVVLYAASSAVDTDFVAKLIDVHPDGAAMLVSSGLARARYRNGFDRVTLLEPGKVEEFTIDLGPTAICIGPGHRLAVYVCSSDFPWFDRNMNTGNPVGVDAEPLTARQTIFHDLSRPSRLELQVHGE